MEVSQVNNGKTVVFIDGQSLFITAKTLGFSIDFKRLLDELKTYGDVIRIKYYTLVDDEDENSPLIPLTDWLSYNGYSVVIKGAVARLVGMKGGVVSGVFNLESSGVEAPDWRPRHDKHYHEA